MNKFVLLVLTTLIVGSLNAQNYDSSRYLSPLFPTVLTTNDVQYGSAEQWVWPYWNEDLFLNVTVPNGDANSNRPLIIFAHAGGFINGSKDVDNMVAICDSFAKLGFVTATIDYRKGFNPADGQSAERAVYRGIQDGKTAIRYFKTNASLYDIDTNYVFFGGMSAGGFIALHVGYMDKESERPSSTYGGGTVNDLGCLDCGDHQGVSSSVRGILDFWGAVQDTTIIESSTDTPVLIMHGENDPTVPFVYGHPFGVGTIPNVYGGQPVMERCNNLGVQNTYITSTGPLHMLDGSDNGTWNPAPNSFWGDTLLPETTTFIYNLIKPNTNYVSAQSQLLCTGTTATLEVTNDHNSSYFVWDFDATNINALSANLHEKTLELEFTTAGIYQIKVVEFNEILCAGDTLTFDVEVEQVPTASYTYLTNGFDVDFTNTSVNGVTYTWDFGDGTPSSTDMNPSHTYAQDGDYTVTLIATSTNGCTSQIYSEQVTISTASLPEMSDYLTLSNPFNNQLTMVSNEPIGFVKIYAVDGKLMYTNQVSGTALTVETSNWQSGLYMVEITNNNGDISYNKLIKM